MNTPGVTGRDGYIIGKALAYAIATIDGLPEGQQERSDRDDMVAVLLAMYPDQFTLGEYADGVERHTGRRPWLVDEKRQEPVAV